MDKGIEQPDITRPRRRKKACGQPGAKPRWASGAKTIVGTSVRPESRIWYTVNEGTLAEVYFPDVDQANTRTVRFLVTGADGFFSDEMWDAQHTVEWLDSGVPGCRIESCCKSGTYRLEKEIIPDPMRDGLLLRGRFVPRQQQPEQQGLRLYLIVDAHIGDRGANNEAWAGEYKGEPMVFARRGPLCFACGSSPRPLQCSVGYIGKSDGLTVLRRGEPLPHANYAPDGNVGLTIEIDYKSNGDGSFLVSLAGGDDSAEAGRQTRAGLLEDYGRTRQVFIQQWRERQAQYRGLSDLSGHCLDMYRVSTAVLETHQSKRFPGGFVAGLSVPWGFARGDKDIGGYHVLWPRDTVETAMGKLASGDAHAARSTLFFLACAQDADGGWSQNMWLDGTPHWTAIQMDAIALPILLADKMRREGVLEGYDPLPMVRNATRFLLRHGPVTQQDRWETTPGYSPNTIAAEVAALLAAADFAEIAGKQDDAEFIRETADAWNDAIDELTYVEDTPLAHKHGVRGYYMRMTPPQRIETHAVGHLRVRMPNVVSGPRNRRAIDVVSPGFLTLVRLGLRAPDNPRITDTLKVIDATLRRETKTGSGWRRSTDDGYGEKADGRPYDTRGIGRCWPLLAGERGHYELAAGRKDVALDLLKTMARQTSQCGMIPEQVWDAEDIPERFLFNGHPSGSGMPLAWAHAEYIKLLRSLHEGAVWDCIPGVEQRYIHDRRSASFQIWTPEQRRGWISQGKDLRLDLTVPARVSWSAGKPSGTAETRDTELGLHCATLPTRELTAGAAIRVLIQLQSKTQDETQIPASFIVRVKA
ncbi:MAG TPA: glycoside hydrolase family 15 protein [Acidobacteriaceae bacterium]|nr:glycoside hydrolase family 15 protein [Acidobacteriaceae bacterium]